MHKAKVVFMTPYPEDEIRPLMEAAPPELSVYYVNNSLPVETKIPLGVADPCSGALRLVLQNITGDDRSGRRGPDFLRSGRSLYGTCGQQREMGKIDSDLPVKAPEGIRFTQDEVDAILGNNARELLGI